MPTFALRIGNGLHRSGVADPRRRAASFTPVATYTAWSATSQLDCAAPRGQRSHAV